jgi:hypothetical protein
VPSLIRRAGRPLRGQPAPAQQQPAAFAIKGSLPQATRCPSPPLPSRYDMPHLYSVDRIGGEGGLPPVADNLAQACRLRCSSGASLTGLHGHAICDGFQPARPQLSTRG